MTKLIHSRKVEKKIKEVMKGKYFSELDKVDHFLDMENGFNQLDEFEEGFNLALKAEKEKLNVYYGFLNGKVLFILGLKESDVLEKISSWKDE